MTQQSEVGGRPQQKYQWSKDRRETSWQPSAVVVRGVSAERGEGEGEAFSAEWMRVGVF